jgi:hypothetical protein
MNDPDVSYPRPAAPDAVVGLVSLEPSAERTFLWLLMRE